MSNHPTTLPAALAEARQRVLDAVDAWPTVPPVVKLPPMTTPFAMATQWCATATCTRGTGWVPVQIGG